MAFEEARESMSDVLRWNVQPKNAEDKSVYLGPVVTGYYVGMKTEVGQNDSNLYELLLSDEGPNKGRKVSVWGSDLLDERFALIPKDCMVRISCLGIQQPKTAKGRPYMGFKVEFDKESVKPAEFVEAAPANQAAVTAAPQTTAPVMAQATAPVVPGAQAPGSIPGF